MPGGRLLLAKPRGHVSVAGVAVTVQHAASVGMLISGRPGIRGTHAALLEKQ